MPKFEKNGQTISTSLPTEAVRLKAAGWREVPAAKPAARPAPKTDDGK